MPVTEYDGFLRVLVRSTSRLGKQHLVDLVANGGNGQCSCEDFGIRQNVRLKDGGKKCWCKHIVMARRDAVRKIKEQCGEQIFEDILNEAIRSAVKEER